MYKKAKSDLIEVINELHKSNEAIYRGIKSSRSHHNKFKGNNYFSIKAQKCMTEEMILRDIHENISNSIRRLKNMLGIPL